MKLQIFKHEEFKSLRVTVNEKGETLFCLTDVCKALGIGNASDVKKRLESGNLDSIEVTTKGKNQHGEFVRTTTMTFIGEPNLYRCIFMSRKDSAKRFQDWVVEVVLPQIRKTGGYIPVDPAVDDDKSILSKALKIAERTLADTLRKLEEQRPMAELGQQVTGRAENIMVGEMAKLLHENGIDIGRQRLFDWMREKGYLFKHSREPMQKWIEQGIMTVRENWIATNHGMKLCVTPMITGRGQQYFLQLFCSQKEAGF